MRGGCQGLWFKTQQNHKVTANYLLTVIVVHCLSSFGIHGEAIANMALEKLRKEETLAMRKRFIGYVNVKLTANVCFVYASW